MHCILFEEQSHWLLDLDHVGLLAKITQHISLHRIQHIDYWTDNDLHYIALHCIAHTWNAVENK